MRFLKISQSIIFKEDSVSGVFQKGQVVKFSGSLSYNNNIVLGYLKQEPITCNSLVLYVKGYWSKDWENNTRELVLVETSKSTNNFSPITLCSYFPNAFCGEADGYMDETIGHTSKEGQYFFHSGKYLATTNIEMKRIAVVTASGNHNPKYDKTKKKVDQMVNRLYVAKNRNKLNFGFLFDFIQPHWLGAHQKLIDRYPN